MGSMLIGIGLLFRARPFLDLPLLL